MPGREPGIVQIQTGGKRGKRCNRGRLGRRGRLGSRGALPILANFPRIQIPGSCSFPSYLGWNLNCVHQASYIHRTYIYRELYGRNSSVFVSQQVEGGDKKEMLMWVLALKSRSQPFLNASQEIEADKRQVSDFPTTTTVNDEKREGNIKRKIHFYVQKYIFDVEKIHLLSHCTAREGGNVCGAPA